MENQEKVDKLDDTQLKFLKEYEDCFGIISIACAKIGIVRQTFYNWLKKSPLFAKRVEEVEVIQIGMVKDKLLKGIVEEDLPSIRFYLERKSSEFKARAELDVYNRQEIDNTIKEIREYLNAHKPKVIQGSKQPAIDIDAKAV